MKRYLGLDISTSHIGICVSDGDAKILLFDSIDYTKGKSKELPPKAILFRHRMTDIIKLYGPFEKVYIEKALLRFADASRIQILVLLQQFNMLCQFVLYELGQNVELIPISTAMKVALGRGVKPKDFDGDKKA